MKKDTVKHKTAAEWQSSDDYPGIDAYEKVQLKAGSKIYALIYRDKGSFDTPAYFFNKEAMEGIGNDSISLNERLQIMPFCPPGEKFGILFADVFRKTTQTFFLEIYCRD
ncbi:MAG: hypothetical protein K6G31_06970 [Paludibacteraceae bacterium]|nr:hypothetical protein [Paludibacteraceae bacterium]